MSLMQRQAQLTRAFTKARPYRPKPCGLMCTHLKLTRCLLLTLQPAFVAAAGQLVIHSQQSAACVLSSSTLANILLLMWSILA